MKKGFVFIHGWSSYKNKLDCAKGLVSQCGYDFISFDLPLHGEFKFQQYDKEYTFDMLADYAIDKINALTDYDELIITGHSMGGGIILLNNDRFKVNVKKIVLIDPLNQNVGIDDRETLANYIADKPKDEPKVSILNNFLNRSVANSINLAKLLKTFATPEFKRRFANVKLDEKYKWYLIYGENDIYINGSDTALWLKTINQSIKTYAIKKASHNPFTDNTEESLEALEKIIKD